MSGVGPKNSNWKGGVLHDPRGYIYLWRPDHPKANCKGYVAEHRLVMQEVVGRPLESCEEVHHRNGIKYDNRPENLDIVLRNMHFGEVRCPYCLAQFKVK